MALAGLERGAERAAAERVAAFLLVEGARVHGARRLWVGSAPRTEASVDGTSALAELSRRRLRGLSEQGRLAVLGLARGTHLAEVAARPFTAREVLALQARGRRCVSLLPAGVELGPYASAFEFCAHDLAHLAKLFEPAHRRGQLGFFRLLHEGVVSGLAGLEARHDPRFTADVEAVGADTNGSAVFAFASLVMKLKMASRRALGRATGVEVTGGSLTPAEEAAFAPDFADLCEVFRVPEGLQAAALTVGARRAEPLAGRALLAHFEALADA